jgi:Fe-S cluster biogenesis protein NfuA
MEIRSQRAAYQENIIMEEKIRAKLEELRESLQSHGGDLEVDSIEGSLVKLRLTGACGGCPHAVRTLKQGIEAALREGVDDSITVEQVE